MQQLGWLSATPETQHEGKTSRWDKTRFQFLKQKGLPLRLPDGSSRYYWAVDYLLEAGPTTFDAMGNERPLDWVDVNEYHKATLNLPAPWMRVLVKELSEAYLSGKNEGKNPLSIPPFDRLEPEDDRHH